MSKKSTIALSVFALVVAIIYFSIFVFFFGEKLALAFPNSKVMKEVVLSNGSLSDETIELMKESNSNIEKQLFFNDGTKRLMPKGAVPITLNENKYASADTYLITENSFDEFHSNLLKSGFVYDRMSDEYTYSNTVTGIYYYLTVEKFKSGYLNDYRIFSLWHINHLEYSLE